METFIKKFKKAGTSDLLKKMEKLSGLEKEACIVVLKERGQDVSKWEAVPVPSTEAPVEVSSSKIYEAEPEEVLSPEDEALILKAEAEESEMEKSSLIEKVEAHVLLFKKGTVSLSKVNQVLRGRKVKKLSEPELRLILSFPVDKAAATSPAKKGESKPKAPKTEGDSPKTEPADSGEYISAGTAVLVSTTKDTVVEGVVVDLKHNDKNVPYYRIKVDGKIMCRVPKFVNLIGDETKAPEVPATEIPVEIVTEIVPEIPVETPVEINPEVEGHIAE